MEESIKGPGAALEARKCFDNIICAAPAGVCPVEMAVIDVTAKHPDFSVVSPLPPTTTRVLVSLPAHKLR